MVAGDVVLVAEDRGQRLVDHVVAQHEHGLGLVALRALGAVDKVDRGAQALVRRVLEHAVVGELGARVAAALADDLVDVEHLGAARVIAAVQVDARPGVGQVAGQSQGDGGAAEQALVHVDAGVAPGGDAHALEVLPRARAHVLVEVHARAGLGDHAQKRRGGAGLAVLLASRRHDDGDLGALADHDAGVGYLSRAQGNHDRLRAPLAARDLHVARAGGLGLGRVRHGRPHAALHALEEARKREVHVAGTPARRHGQRDVVGSQAVPGLRGGNVDALEGDLGRRGASGPRSRVLLSHHPIAPSISSLMRLFISTAYSIGSSLETGLAKPLTTSVRASASEQPRLMR